MITTAEELDELVSLVGTQERIGVDTEADSLHCYFEKLCLIQISAPGKDALVDPLAGLPLHPLYQVLSRRELILHGADFDLRLLRRAGNVDACSVFDTMIAARLVGCTEFSLAALILRHFGIELAKGSQKANWAKRPLSPQMAEYAVNDTKFLLELSQILEAQLRSLGRWEWFRQSCERAIESSKITKVRDPEMAWRINGSNELRGRGWAVLRALWHWREEEAKAVDRPCFHILRNEELIVSARRFDLGQLVEIRHLRGSRKTRFFEAAERALQLPEEEWPKPIRRPRMRSTPDQDRLFQALKTRRDQSAAELNLDPALIAPKAALEAAAADREAAFKSLLPWQRELIGLEP